MGWGIAMFIVGIALDQSKWFSDHPCGNVQAGNYTCLLKKQLLT